MARRMKASMEMEYVMKLIIMLVVVAAVIGLIWTFYGGTQSWWCKMMGTCGGPPPVGDTEVIKQATFTATDVAKYVDSCWMRTGDKRSGDFVCYVLQGRFNASPEAVAPLLHAFPKEKLLVETDFRGDAAVITFIDIGNKMKVS